LLALLGWGWIPAVHAKEADTADAAASDASDEPAIIVFGRAEAKIGIAKAASEGTIAGSDLLVRPLLRTAELLEAVPGMIAAQHSGSGKANQYFLRGFNLDHGSDFTTYIDGVQMNLRTHGHGQGYLDLNGLISEIVEREDYRKGPYFADGGDFALAGAVHMRTVRHVTAPFLAAEGGSFGYFKVAAGGTIDTGAGGALTLIGRYKQYDGPWQEPERLRHYAAFAKFSAPVGGLDLAVSLHGYHATWRPTEQIPERIVGTALCPDAFCSPDPSARGRTTRLVGNVELQNSRVRANASVQYYDWAMSSNPTYANPDGSSAQILQFDRRWIFGLKGEWMALDRPALTIKLGTENRLDVITRVGLATAAGGVPVASLGDFGVTEGSAAAFAETTWKPWEPLRLTASLRADYYTFLVRAHDAPGAAVGEGSGSKLMVSPKAGVAWRLSPRLEAYANWGRGFHSNDVRGVVSGTPVPLLVAGTGKELGLRYQTGKLSLTFTYWWLGVGSELRFVGDSNAVEPTGASNRRGYEIVAFWRPRSWLAIDGNFTASRSRYDTGEYIPNAFENAGQIGVSIIQPRWEASVRWRHLGPYPLLEDNSVRDRGSNVVNLRAAFKPGRFEIYGEVLNVLGSGDKDIAYAYESYLPAFDKAPVEDRLSRVVEPRTFRIGGKVKF
jgi:outer membrane receptor protein involved in Fe transport